MDKARGVLGKLFPLLYFIKFDFPHTQGKARFRKKNSFRLDFSMIKIIFHVLLKIICTFK